MNNEALEALVKMEEDYTKEASTLDALLDTDDRQKATITLEKAQKLEHEERRMRLEESRQKLESEKLEYQKKQNKKDNIVKIVIGSATAAGSILVGIAKLIQIHISRKAIREAYAIDQVTTLTSKTARDLLSGMTNPKI
jgi:hypothetical protein